MKVVIVEDEIHAYTYLKNTLISIDRDIEVVKHLESVADALNYFNADQSANLIFLDIQLADGLSFEIFNHIQISIPIIFTTAYDQYSLDAFKLYSIDYLMKPIAKEDIELSLTKYKKYYSNDRYKQSNVEKLIDNLSRNKKNRCLVKKGNHFEYINTSEVAFVNSADSITFLHTIDGKKYMYSRTIEQMILELDESQFYQINRAQIINSKVIKEIHSYFNQRLKLVLNIGSPNHLDFVVSRNRLSGFKSWMDR